MLTLTSVKMEAKTGSAAQIGTVTQTTANIIVVQGLLQWLAVTATFAGLQTVAKGPIKWASVALKVTSETKKPLLSPKYISEFI